MGLSRIISAPERAIGIYFYRFGKHVTRWPGTTLAISLAITFGLVGCIAKIGENTEVSQKLAGSTALLSGRLKKWKFLAPGVSFTKKQNKAHVRTSLRMRPQYHQMQLSRRVQAVGYSDAVGTTAFCLFFLFSSSYHDFGPSSTGHSLFSTPLLRRAARQIQ